MKYLIGILFIVAMLGAGCTQQPAQNDREAAPIVEQQKNPIPTMQEQEKPEIDAPKQPNNAGSVQILGKDGFDPMELTIQTGDSVEFMNTLAKDETLVFKLSGNAAMENTPVIKAGGVYQKVFEKSGTYEFWSVGFGPTGAKIVVE